MDSAAIHKGGSIGSPAKNQAAVFNLGKIFVGGEKPAMVSRREDLYAHHRHSLSQSPSIVNSPEID